MDYPTILLSEFCNMATYFHGAPEMQSEGLQTLYLMNPGGYVCYPDAALPATNMVFMNSSISSHQYPMMATVAHNPQPDHQQQHLLGIPLHPMTEMKASNGLQSALMGSKYLKAAQLLLDEVVSIDNGDRDSSAKARPISRKSEGVVHEADGNPKRGADLTAAERQELQMKKGKLVSMLDEVERRYRQYRHQMQIVVSSFEAIVGFRSAKTYTALALQTISKQFRCLRDAITGQIRATSKSLGEEECAVGAAKSGGSTLRFVDQQLRQQKASQQLGMVQHNAWRPQRGLPECAVSVLRAWLFEHFLHPYPKDADKHMLAKQTGLTRSQVSNWFINARVRLWKPMVEEMYMQEFKEQEQTNAGVNTSNFDSKEEASSNSSALEQRSPTRIEQNVTLQTELDILNEPRAPPMNPIVIPPSASEVDNHETIMQASLNMALNEQPVRIETKPETASNRKLLMKFIDGGNSWGNGYPLIPSATNNGAGFGSYSVGEIGKFNHEHFAPRFSGNSVSLTLGLPHSENLSLSTQQQQHQQQQHYLSSESCQLGRRVDTSTESTDYYSLNSSSNPTASSHPPNAYESINIQNRKRFAAQLLPDFVA